MNFAERTIYLDYNASAPLASECEDAVMVSMRPGMGNPSSKHHAGERAKQLITAARVQVAELLNALPAEIVFTSGGTESNHHAILGALALQPGRRHVVTSAVEHPSTLQLLRHLEQTQGVRVTRLRVDAQGCIELEAIEAAVSADTALVSLMWANNETGVLFPVAAAARISKAKGVLFHTDAVQALGKVPVNVAEVAADFISFSGHKLHAPPGIGGLYIRKGLKLPALLHGHQERNRRGGTENLGGIAALGVACLLAGDGLCTHASKIAALRDRLERGITERVPFASVNGAGAPRVANTTNIRFGDMDADALMGRLDREGICVAQGAACSAGGSEPSHVLTAMGLTRAAALASLRFSLGRYTTVTDIDTVLERLPRIVGSLAAAA